MTMGPTEYVIIKYPGSQFNGKIAPALSDLISSGTIRLLDIVFINKDAAGNVLAVEFDEHELLADFGDLDGEVGGIFTPDDLEHAARGLEPGSSAALLMWEDTWAIPLADAMRDSGGVLVEGARIPYDIAEAAFGELATSS